MLSSLHFWLSMRSVRLSLDDACHFFALMERCLGAVGLFLAITRATFFFFTTILVVRRPSSLCKAVAEHQLTEDTGGYAHACLVPPEQVAGAVRQHGDTHAHLVDLSVVLWCPVIPAGLSWSGLRPNSPPDQWLTAHPGALASVSVRGESDYLNLQIHPWGPQGPRTSSASSPTSATTSF